MNSERKEQRSGCDCSVLQMAVVEQTYTGELYSAFLSQMLTPPQVTDENIELPQQCSRTFNLVQIYDVNSGKILPCFPSEMKWNVFADIK